jgi:methylmalonyl-CoA mutase
MTINGPAPTMLAFFLNTVIDQQVAVPKPGTAASRRGGARGSSRRTPWQNVRGTVQADILKEDQGQNTCLFSTEFSLRMMADIQEWFIEHGVRNFYSVSISGYHIAEAGANPISQLAFTLANGFTYVEAYLARGMDDRRLRAEPVVLLLQRHGPRVLRASVGSPAASGRSR